jgi:hypothetical protein
MGTKKGGNEDSETLLEILFKCQFMVLAVCASLMLCGCGRNWERFWGQDTKPEIKYIPMRPDFVEFGITSVSPAQWADKRFRDAKYLNVWACSDDNYCLAIPEDRPAGDSLLVYVIKGGDMAGGCMLFVYNVKAIYPNATKIRVQFVL